MIEKNSLADSRRQRYVNHGRLRLFRVRSRKTRIHLKILGLCFTSASIYFTKSISNLYFVDFGFQNVGNSLIVSNLANLVGSLGLVFLLHLLNRRLAIKVFQVAISGELTSRAQHRLLPPDLLRPRFGSLDRGADSDRPQQSGAHHVVGSPDRLVGRNLHHPLQVLHFRLHILLWTTLCVGGSLFQPGSPRFGSLFASHPFNCFFAACFAGDLVLP